jgi:hypothetical protein
MEIWIAGLMRVGKAAAEWFDDATYTNDYSIVMSVSKSL